MIAELLLLRQTLERNLILGAVASCNTVGRLRTTISARPFKCIRKDLICHGRVCGGKRVSCGGLGGPERMCVRLVRLLIRRQHPRVHLDLAGGEPVLFLIAEGAR